ncbi:ubiquinone biosynthesis accessory factor UbiJ [Halotalea alkalilenta]|uniref:Ubiquinone biosynthesis accessory factor UbiJ n=1 Tax=Halotalea alkalilenta TaxID=376489 RepID=A0A172YCJ4_9GAMM|nr:SCP2 sterol-binding domain-containing protein [Halotalea alkalilenta]ANF56970.1 hypothetical protein A5892_05405 [Halotalea alkalilenta]
MTLLAPFALACIETTLNRLLGRDPAAAPRLGALDGRRVLLRLERPSLLLLVHFQRDGLNLAQLVDAEEGDADAVVELDLDALGALAAGESVDKLMFEGRLAVRGDIQLLHQVRTLLLDLDVDWEGGLAELVGETPAQALALGIRRLAAFGVRSGRELREDLREYALEEGRLLAGRDQLAVAREQLTLLEISIDRLQARLARIERLLGERHGGGSVC